MRAIWDAVSAALMGVPSAQPKPGGGEPKPEEESHGIINPSELASHFKTLVEEKLAWVTNQPAPQPPDALAIEASEAPEAAEPLELSALSSQGLAEPSPSVSPSEEGAVEEPLLATPPPAAQPPAALAIDETSELPLEELPEEAPLQPAVLFSEEGEGAFKDFFLFIKDYGWSLRYRVHQLTDSILDLEKPLHLEWVKLRHPVSNPDELLSTTSDELFDWDVKSPPSHHGFMYHVTKAVGSGVEAVINFFEGYGLKLLIQPDSGIQLTGGPEKSEKSSDDEPRSVTHCWVQVMGMPFLPILQSIAFFHLEERVMDWSA